MWENIEKILKERHISVLQLSKNTNIPATTIYSWKSGKITPASNRIKIIAEYLGVSVAYLMGATDVPDKELTEEEARQQITELEEHIKTLEQQRNVLLKENKEMDKLITLNYDLLKNLSINEEDKNENERLYNLFLRIKCLSPEQLNVLISIIEQFSK